MSTMSTESPLSIKAVAAKLSPVFDTTPLSDFYRQAAELGLAESYIAWHAELTHTYFRAGIEQEPSEYYEMFWHRLFAFHGEYYEEIIRQGGNVMEAFLREELRIFIEGRPQEWHTILDELGSSSSQQTSGKNLKQIHEVCFLPGVLIPWCMETERLWNQAKAEFVKKKKQLRSKLQQIEKEQLLSDCLKSRMRLEVSLCLEQTEEFILPMISLVNALKSQIGIDKKYGIAVQKHFIWRAIFQYLVVLLKPYFIESSPKHFYLEDEPTEEDPRPRVPKEAILTASRIMNLSHPKLWEDNPELVKNHVYPRIPSY